jgi:tRNA wybutosine-synthesizing protein 5
MNNKVLDKVISVHVCPDLSGRLDFVRKNFVFKSLPFGEFLQRISVSQERYGTPTEIEIPRANVETKNEITRDSYFISPQERYYLRALGDNARKETADFSRDFPELCKYFKAPAFLPSSQTFSSVFRVSSNDMQLWTHYDVADNLLCHLVGRKRVVLFPPEQSANLYLPLAPNSSSSPVLDIDHLDPRYPRFADAHKEGIEVILEPGDILFIPAFWFHNVRSLSYAVSVNIFWQQHPLHVYAQKDLYGNKDLPAGVNSMKSAVDVVTNLSQLPDAYRGFYKERIQAIMNSDPLELLNSTPTIRS